MKSCVALPQNAKKNLRALFASSTDKISTGLENLRRSQGALQRFTDSFNRIDTICSESRTLIDTDESLRELATVHSSLMETLRSTETVAGLPEAAERAEKILNDRADPVGLIETYVYLSKLEAIIYKINLTLAELQDKSKDRVLPSLETYFRQVHGSMSKIEHRLWYIVRKFMSISRKSPATLVAAVRIIEIQEAVDSKLLSNGLGSCTLRKGWRQQCIQNMSGIIAESFAPILQRCSKILSSEVKTSSLLQDILEEIHNMISTFEKSQRYFEPCFPPFYRIKEFVLGEYNVQMESVIALIAKISEQLSNADILFTMSWIQTHEKYIVKEGQSLDDTCSTRTLIETYVERMDQALRSWMGNIMRSDFGMEPHANSNGHLFTPGPQDTFRLLEEQFRIGEEGGLDLSARVASKIFEILDDYYKEYQRKLEGEQNSLETLCAISNNSLRCAELGKNLQLVVVEYLEQKYEGFSTEHHLPVPEYVSLAKESAATCGKVIFTDPGFGEIFSQMCCSKEWRSGIVTGSILATLDDFFQDLRVWLVSELFQILAMTVLNESVSHFMAAILSQLRTVNDGTIGSLRRDHEALSDFFRKYLTPDAVQEECQILSDMCDFLESDSVESFVLSYSSLLDSVLITPVLLSGVLNARVSSQQDMTKSDAKEVLSACREVYEEIKKVHIGKPEIEAKKFGVNIGLHNPAFLAALSAARQRY